MNRAIVPEKLAALLLALALDLGAGEPPARIHPVVGVGKLLETLAKRVPSGPRRELAYGAVCVGVVTLVPAFGTKALHSILKPGPLSIVVVAWLLKTCFAYRALEEAACAVAEPLSARDLPAARETLISLVGRDRSGLDESEVCAAAIESLAENLGDGFVAPLLAYAVGGLPAAVFYRAANTADSMIGHRGRYEYLGKTAARLDDALNLVPARFTAILILVVSGSKAREAWRTAVRDHVKTSSPNAGWPMAAAAGSLGISLQKPADYHLNPEAREPNVEDVHRALGLCRRAAFLFGVLVLVAATMDKRSA